MYHKEASNNIYCISHTEVSEETESLLPGTLSACDSKPDKNEKHSAAPPLRLIIDTAAPATYGAHVHDAHVTCRRRRIDALRAAQLRQR